MDPRKQEEKHLLAVMLLLTSGVDLGVIEAQIRHPVPLLSEFLVTNELK